MKCFVLSENEKIENRVSVTPEITRKITDSGHEVFVEKGAGARAGFVDSEYKVAGAFIADKKSLAQADIVFSINPPTSKDIKSMKSGAISVALQDPYHASDNIEQLCRCGISSFALELMPRTTRAQYMDVLSSQAGLAGYRAVIEAAHLLNRAMPLTMTTAGTIQAAKVLVAGAGVAGLQAIATAKRLGAVVSAFDVRASAKEQVESLGAKFIEIDSREMTDGVYAAEMSNEYQKAQEARLRAVLPEQDIVITTAQIPGKKAPIIIKSDMVELMKNGSLIIDLSSKTGGNCELTKSEKIVEKDGVKIVAFDNILNSIAFDASRLFAKNVFSFFELLQKTLETQDLTVTDDEIIKATLLTHNGSLVNEKIAGL